MAYINLKNIGVEFPIYDSRSRSLKSAALNASGRLKYAKTYDGDVVNVQALRDINLSLKEGDRIGLIGGNGSGKSTLLRVMAGVYEPTIGSMEIEGTCASLLGLWGGMDHSASGYENIVLMGIASGLSRKEIAEQTDEIIEFADIGEHINLPLRTYSSGMQLRIAFAIATAVAADITLIDEVIGVGDAEFVKKAQQRLKKFMNKSRILVLASHFDRVLRENCDSGVVMQGGCVTFCGPIEDALNHYHRG